MDNKTLAELIKIYAIQEHEDVHDFLANLSRDTLSAVLVDLLTLYLNDRNSSTLREWLTLVIAGYKPAGNKLGYNGYRMSGPGGVSEYCEVKPLNVYRRPDGKWSRKLHGGGNFSDYTPERLQKDLEQGGLYVLTSGFAEGKLLYVVRFPFACLQERLEQLLRQRFPENVRTSGQYLRSASFTYQHYRNCEIIEVVFRAKNLEPYRDAFTGYFYAFLNPEERRINV